METIAKGEVPFDDLDVSDSLLSLLKMTLEKDPEQRAGVGDCLQHPFLQAARKTRINQLSDEFILSHEKVTVGEDDIRAVRLVVRLQFLLSVCVYSLTVLQKLSADFLTPPCFLVWIRHSKLSQSYPACSSRVQQRRSRVLASILHALLTQHL